MNIAIGCDHAGFELKEQIKNYLLNNKNYRLKDFGCYSEERVDYPDYAHAVSLAIENKEMDLGILICGSGNGINITANKHKGIRAALCWNEEIAALSRKHNDANVLSLAGRFIDKATGIKCVEAFLNNQFEGGRHADRVNKISGMEC